MLLLIAALVTACQAVDFEITNNAGGPVWIGTQGNTGKPPLDNGGFVLNTGQTRTVQSPDDWAGRFWARTYCDPNSNHCLTGDCGNKLECNGAGGEPPATLAEIKLKGYAGLDTYDISLVDGFNLKGSMEPVDGQADSSEHSCKQSSCNTDINQSCPDELKVNSEHGVVACKNDKSHADFYKQACPDAYSFDSDDPTSTFTCKANKMISIVYHLFAVLLHYCL